MAANTSPIFPLTPNVGWQSAVATANTAKDMATGTTYLVFTAGANGSRLDTIKVRHRGTNSTATALRVFLNNGSDTTSAANNTLYMERTIAANTNSETAESTDYEIALDIALPANYRVYVTIGTAANLAVTAVGGDY